MVVEGQRLGGGDGASSKKAGGEAGVTPGDPDGKEDGKGKKKRQAYLLGGKTLLLSDEERSIYELTLGKGLYQVDAGPTPDAQPAQPPQQPSSSGPPAAPGGKAAAAIKGRASPTPSRAASHGPVSHAGSHAGASDGGAGRGAERDSSPAGAGFSCQAAGVTLEVWQWASLWTVEHLRARLLEPLSGVSMAVAPHVATLTFDTERTAMVLLPPKTWTRNRDFCVGRKNQLAPTSLCGPTFSAASVGLTDRVHAEICPRVPETRQINVRSPEIEETGLTQAELALPPVPTLTSLPSSFQCVQGVADTLPDFCVTQFYS